MKTSLLRWYGGKYYILNKILPFPQHKTYFEIFGGSAVVLLNKIKSTSEIYNDINSILVKFWKVIEMKNINCENLILFNEVNEK